MIPKLILFVTSECNFDCVYCRKSSRNIAAGGAVHLSPEIVKRLLREVDLSETCVTLTGGEPAMSPHFEEIVELLDGKVGELGTMTNGSMTGKYLNVLDHLDFIGISVDGVDGVHTAQRFGTVNAPFQAMQKYAERGVVVSSMTVVTPVNLEQIPRIVQATEMHGGSMAAFGGVVPIPGVEIPSKFGFLADKERFHSISILEWAKEQAAIDCLALESLWTRGGVRFCRSLSNLDGLSVWPDGRTVFCCDIEHDGGVIGDLTKESFGTVLRRGREVCDSILELRESLYEKNVRFDGFDTCEFCNQTSRKLRF